MAVDEVIIKFKGKVVFQQYISKKRNWFGINIYQLCDKPGYTFNMRMYLGKQRKWLAQMLHPVTREGHTHILYEYSFFEACKFSIGASFIEQFY
jgi:hypothetical protein